jgi:hypothetical protein
MVVSGDMHVCDSSVLYSATGIHIVHQLEHVGVSVCGGYVQRRAAVNVKWNRRLLAVAIRHGRIFIAQVFHTAYMSKRACIRPRSVAADVGGRLRIHMVFHRG